MKNDLLKLNISKLLSKLLKKNNKKFKLSIKKNINLNENLYNLNKINIDVKKNKNFIRKLNYFDSYNKTKQNKELIKFKPININNLTDLSISKKNFFNTKYISKTKLLNLILKSFKLLNRNLVLYIKNNGLYSILNILKQSKIRNFTKIINLNNIKIKKEKEFNYINLKINNKLYSNIIVPLKLKEKTEKELEKEIKTKKYIEKAKNNFYLQVNKNTTKNLLLNNFLKKNQHLLELTNSILEINKFNKIKDKQIENVNLQKRKKEIIRKHIHSKIIFNSKIAKLLSSNNNYNFYKYNKLNTSIRNKIYEFLHRSFISMSSLISKPIFINTPEKIIIQLFYLFLNKPKNYTTTINKYIRNNKNNFLKENNKIIFNKKEKQGNKNLNLFENNTKSILILENKKKLNIICNILTRFLKKPIELELVRLYYPYYNSNILVNLFGIFINKIKLRKIIRRFIDNAVKSNYSKFVGFENKFISLPKKLTGIKIKVAGRLLTQRVVPRRTVKIVSAGALNKTNSTLLETARFTNKNKRGAFSLTISIGHRLRYFSTFNHQPKINI